MLLLCLILVLSVFQKPWSGEASSLGGTVTFHEADPGESHVDTCLRNNLSPTSRLLWTNWNATYMAFITSTVDATYTVNTTASSAGLVGCCGRGLWCRHSMCFTQGFGDHFENVGWLASDVKYEFSPVYSCHSGDNNGVDSSPDDDLKVRSKTGVENAMEGELDVLWEGDCEYGPPACGFEDDPAFTDVVDVYVGPQTCVHTEVCSSVCKQCDARLPAFSQCGANANCVYLRSFDAYCLPYCSGPGDTSCPCDSICVEEALIAGSRVYENIFVCYPDTIYETVDNDYYTSACELYMESGSDQYDASIRCDIQSAPIKPPEPGGKRTFAVAEHAGGLVRTDMSLDVTVWTHETTELSYNQEVSRDACSNDQDCFDGNPCSKRECNPDYRCDVVSTPLEGRCDSYSHGLRERSTMYAYLSFFAGASPTVAAAQAKLKADITDIAANDGDNPALIPLSTSASPTNGKFVWGDDTGSGVVQLRSDFRPRFFGSEVQKIAARYGYLALGDTIRPCEHFFLGPACQQFVTDSNILATWFGPWDVSDGGEALLYLGDRASSPPDSLRDTITLYMSGARMFDFNDETLSADSAEFAMQLFQDSGVKLDYWSVIDSDMTKAEYMGLWGSKRSSQSDAEQSYRYNRERVERTDLAANTSVVYCHVEYTAVCPRKSCLAKKDELELNWNVTAVPTCVAVGLSWECVWAGLTRTLAHYDHATHRLVCKVPDLDDKIANGSLLQVTIEPVTNATGYEYYAGAGIASADVLHTLIFDGETRVPAAAPIMIRYYSSSAPACQCSPFEGHEQHVCGACGQCTEAKYSQMDSLLDCNGDCFGSAYEDITGTCAGGRTGIAASGPEVKVYFSDEETMKSLNLHDAVMAIGYLVVIMVILIWTRAYLFNRMIEANVRNGQEHIDGIDMVVRRRPQGRRGGTGPNGAAGGGPGLATDSLKKLPSLVYSAVKTNDALGSSDHNNIEAGAGEDAEEECTICLAAFTARDSVRAMPECKHVFHAECIDGWLSQQDFCPLCKRKVKIESGVLVGVPEVAPAAPEAPSGGASIPLFSARSPRVAVMRPDGSDNEDGGGPDRYYRQRRGDAYRRLDNHGG